MAMMLENLTEQEHRERTRFLITRRRERKEDGWLNKLSKESQTRKKAMEEARWNSLTPKEQWDESQDNLFNLGAIHSKLPYASKQ